MKSMHKGARAALFTVGMLIATAGLGQAAPDSGDDRIVAAREAVRKGDRNTLERLALEPSSHPLDPYVRYWRLINVLARPETPPAPMLEAFLEQEAGSMLAERVRVDWLRRMATTGRPSSPSSPACSTPTAKCGAPRGPRS